MTTTAITTYTDMTPVIALVTDGLTSDHSRRAYRRALETFGEWYNAAGRPGLTKATINSYRAYLVDRGLSSSSVNQALSAVRKLAAEAADNGLMDSAAAEAIGRVKGVKQAGRRAGNWLTKAEAQALLDTPDTGAMRGQRDRAILAVMVGGGLRRSEVAGLTFDRLQQRDGRWVIVDLVGKGGRVRSVPIPSWAKAAVDEWATAAGLHDGRIFRSINRGGRLDGDGMTPQAVYNVVATYATRTGLGVAAHDLRRTFAKLAHKGGAALEQIQLTLGHSSIQTTERYLGVDQDLSSAPCDVLGLSLAR